MNVHAYYSAVAATLLYLASVVAGSLALHDVAAFRWAIVSIGLTALSYVAQLIWSSGYGVALLVGVSWLAGIVAGVLVIL